MTTNESIDRTRYGKPSKRAYAQWFEQTTTRLDPQEDEFARLEFAQLTADEWLAFGLLWYAV